MTGSEVKEYGLNGNNTVADLFLAADKEFNEDYKIRVNGEVADGETELTNGDIVTVAGKIEGGNA